ncbi:MAG TPA: O-antigen ligase family protein, partial [Solirubrobacteraceae bacterium]|nr:O-antigen ligase family protein [Solirubrobacteraceae bacterium]
RAGLTAGLIALGAAFTGYLLSGLAAGSQSGALLLAPVALVVLAYLALRPALLLMLIFSVTVLLEISKGGPAPFASDYYHPVGRGLTVMNLLTMALFVAVALELYRRRLRPRFGGPLTPAFLLLIGAVISGAATAHFAGIATKDIFEPIVTLAPLLLFPFVVVNLARTRPRLVGTMLPLIGLLAGLKALVGLWLALSGRGSLVDGHAATYIEPAANWLNLLVALAILAAALRRVRLPAWAWALGPLALAELAFSYRRGFWLGAILGIAVVVIFATPPRARRAVFPSIAVVGLLGWLTLSGLGAGGAQSTSPVLKRLSTLQPSKLELNVQDRYRLDERRNVIANLEEHPITGLGIAVPWVAPHPLSVTHPGDRTYTHIVLFWYWLNLGLLGVLAYLALMASAIGTALLVWRRHAAPLVRCAALGLMATLVGSLATETTGSYTGVDVRFTMTIGAILGLLAAAYFETRAGSERPVTSVRSSPTSTARRTISRPA